MRRQLGPRQARSIGLRGAALSRPALSADQTPPVLPAPHRARSARRHVFPPEERPQNFGLVGAAFGCGFIAGPAIGGLLGEIGPRAPFYATALLTFVNFVYGLVVLPETLRPENRRPFDLKRANLRRREAFRLVSTAAIGKTVHRLSLTARSSIATVWSAAEIAPLVRARKRAAEGLLRTAQPAQLLPENRSFAGLKMALSASRSSWLQRHRG